MIYCMSDLHGRYDKYKLMLEKIAFSQSDVLYVLGDVIDRGPCGIDILLDMKERKNVVPVLGNHEHMAIPVLKAISEFPEALDKIVPTKAHKLWMANGGEVTENRFCRLTPDRKKSVVEYLNDFIIYVEVEAGGNKFHLSHTLPEYDEKSDIHDVSLFRFVWGEPDYNTRYDAQKLFVTGHTPTFFIDEKYRGRIYKNAGHIAIDCGAVFDNCALGCVRLDDLEEFYV